MKKLNKSIKIGLLLIVLTLIPDALIGLPEFVTGLSLGAGLALLLVGAFTINHDMSKFKRFKANILKNIFQ
ncbi:hypothetical protein [Dethiothermospora halolimnae]|uniref:hypothetical protein n=1 Tax=Dethiothermospora halolimnae TaxID=3114390 RepID=UPI003CCBDE94